MKKLLYLIVYFLSPLPIILTLYSSNPVRYGNFSAMFPMVLGSVAFTWLTWQFVISSRPKFIEKHFGMDRMYRFHGWMAIFAIIIAISHKLLEYEGTFATTLGEIALYIFIGVSGLTLVLMVDSIIAKWGIIKWIRKQLKPLKILQRRNYVILHNITIVALVMIFVHVLLSTSAKQFLSVRLIYITYFSLGAGFYLIHRLFFAKPKGIQRFIVHDVIQESPVTWTLHLRQEKNQAVEYLPGQFGFFRFFGENIPTEEHPFSISSGAVNKEFLTVTIKELGDFTSQIKKIKKGDRAVLDGPYGKFSYISYPNERETVLVAGGVGITPVLSMLRYMSEFDRERKVMLLWGINTKEDMICKEELQMIQKKMKGLSVLPVLSGQEEWDGLTGRVTADLIDTKIKELGLRAETAGIYLCGPPPMMDSIISGLKKKEKKYNLHFEKFSL